MSLLKTPLCLFFFRFATKEPNGLLLYNGRFNEKHDFIAMEIINEQIQLTFSAGREVLYKCAVQKVQFNCHILESVQSLPSLYPRWDQDHGFPPHPRRHQRRPVAHSRGSLLQQGLCELLILLLQFRAVDLGLSQVWPRSRAEKVCTPTSRFLLISNHTKGSKVNSSHVG